MWPRTGSHGPCAQWGDVYASWEATRPPTHDWPMTCVSAAMNAGHDVGVVNQTTPEQQGMGLRTVCVLTPGLLPIDFGWTRQRALTLPRLRTAAVGADCARQTWPSRRSGGPLIRFRKTLPLA